MTRSFYSHGKLLITGEYLVLKGAKVLALPLKLGQEMVVEERSGNAFLWESFYGPECWFRFLFSAKDIIEGNGNTQKERFLLKLLAAARTLNPSFLGGTESYSIKNHLEFSPDWGLGSSSTLIRNVALWAGIDPFALNRLVSNGSGYDVACAGSERPLFYQLVDGLQFVEPVGFNPVFSDSLYFVWFGKKQPTQEGIDDFLANRKITIQEVAQVSEWTERITLTNYFKEFCQLLTEHNRLLERILGKKSIQAERFSDFEGTIKPLGAWGGDFILVASETGDLAVKNYFKAKGLEVIFKWDQLVIYGRQK